MNIGLDVMGGDFAPQNTIAGVIAALPEISRDDSIVLIGKEELIKEELSKQGASPSDFKIVNATQVIEMGDKPLKAFQEKTDSSLSVGFRMLKNQEIDTFSSAGNSGAVGAGAMQSVHNIPGVIRPCAATTLAREDGGYNLLLDIGTTTDVKADVMVQFGLIGSIYAQALLGEEKPRVCLLNIGTEEGKGNLQCQAAYRLMSETNAYNFIGNLEPRDIFSNKADVFVTDGFVGNILLKQIETFYHLMHKRGYNDPFIANFNYEVHGGSPILGLNAPVVLGHGISSALAIKNMLLLSKRMVDTRMTEKLKQAFSQYADNF